MYGKNKVTFKTYSFQLKNESMGILNEGVSMQTKIS